MITSRLLTQTTLLANCLIFGLHTTQAGTSTDATSNELIDLAPYTITATVLNIADQETSGSVLQTQKAVDLAELLSSEFVELSMIRKSGYGNEVTVRGFGQENLRVLVNDGILEGACGSRKDPSLSHINFLDVQSIELLEGPFDVTKPGGLGGHINVISREPNPGSTGELLAKASSYGFRSIGFVQEGGSDQVQALIGYNYSQSGSYKDGNNTSLWQMREGAGAAYNEAGQKADAFQKHDVWTRFNYSPNENNTLKFSYAYGRGLDILTPRVAFDTGKEVTQLSKLSWEWINPSSPDQRIEASIYRNEVDHYPNQEFRNVGVPKNNIVNSTITGAAIKHLGTTDTMDWQYGIDCYQRDWFGDVYNSLTGALLNDNLIPSVRTRDAAAFAQFQYKQNQWQWDTGIRAERHQQEAGEYLKFSKNITDTNKQSETFLSGFVSTQYKIDAQSTLFAGIGISNRTPTSTERYIQGNPSFFGNPDLKPTRNTEFDLGYRWNGDTLSVQVNTFYSDLSDYIYQEYNAVGYKSYTNIDAELWGGKINTDLRIDEHFSLQAGLAYQRGRKSSYPDQNTDRDLGQIPPLKTRLALEYRKDALEASIDWVHAADADSVDASVGEQDLPSWDTINLHASYRYKNLTFILGIDNLFDEDYTVANSYEWDVVGGTGAAPVIISEPGRTLHTSVRLNW